MDREQIEQWIKEGVITEKQATRMRTDIAAGSRDQSSRRFIAAVATIGAILLGIGAVTFLGSKWHVIPNMWKVLLLLGGTVSAYYAGYYCSSQDKGFPTVGASLIFLGSMLFGATVFLTSQMYQMNLSNVTLYALWFIGVWPSAYLFRSALVMGVSCVLACFWVGAMLFGFNMFGDSQVIAGNVYALPSFFIIAGFLLFEVGALHYLRKGYESIAQMYRHVGIQVVLVCLFLLTFRWPLSIYAERNVIDGMAVTKYLTIAFMLVTTAALGLSIFRMRTLPSKEHPIFEHGLGIMLVLAAVAFFMWPPQTAIAFPAFRASIALTLPAAQLFYALLFNVLMAALIVFLFFVGYSREDIVLINSAGVWSCVLILARYYDWFWDLLSRSIFFLIGGALLLILGIFVEKKRRELRDRFLS